MELFIRKAYPHEESELMSAEKFWANNLVHKKESDYGGGLSMQKEVKAISEIPGVMAVIFPLDTDEFLDDVDSETMYVIAEEESKCQVLEYFHHNILRKTSADLRYYKGFAVFLLWFGD